MPNHARPRRTVLAAARASFIAVLLALSTAQRAPAAPVGAPAYFLISTQPHERGYVVAIDDPATIAEARALLRHGKTKIATGIIATKAAPYNPRWKFHFLPGTVRLADMTTEVCDASASYVEEHLNEVGGHFLPGHRWCPWGTKLLREVPGGYAAMR